VHPVSGTTWSSSYSLSGRQAGRNRQLHCTIIRIVNREFNIVGSRPLDVVSRFIGYGNPFGFFCCQFQPSRHMSSSSNLAFQPSLFSALVGSAYAAAISPSHSFHPPRALPLGWCVMPLRGGISVGA
jgi:hypothetical protein